MQFWWVNHNQTGRQEIEGRYLWSPKARSDGKRNVFYDSMRHASPGDLVLSYFDQAVRYVGRVTEFAFTAPKPLEFGTAGANWSNEGWLLPVFWAPLASPVRPKALIDVLRPLLPRKYSPIRPETGAGNQAVYLAAIAQSVFDVITAGAAFDAPLLMQGGANSLTFQVVREVLDDAVERRIEADAGLDSTTKAAVIAARRGQGQFRESVRGVERSCRLTGITNPSLVIASHIKPWRLCATASERLDGNNGLLLTPDADLLFDRGFISFEDGGQVLVSPRFDRNDLRRLGLQQDRWEDFGFSDMGMPWLDRQFVAPQQGYLAFHRSEIFVA